MTRVVQSFSIPDGSKAHQILIDWKSEGHNISANLQLLIEGNSDLSNHPMWPVDWKKPNSSTIIKMRKITCILFDVDGVFTDGTILRDDSGIEQRRFSVIDGHGIQLLRDAGLLIGIISRENSEITRSRMEKLKIAELHIGAIDKSLIVREIKQRHNLENDEIAFMGDDLPDLAAFMEVGLRLSPRNAQPRVRNESDWVSRSAGGSGAVREVAEVILHCKSQIEYP